MVPIYESACMYYNYGEQEPETSGCKGKPLIISERKTNRISRGRYGISFRPLGFFDLHSGI